MLRMVALQEFEYPHNVTLRKPGDEFELEDDKHSIILEATGRARLAEQAAEPTAAEPEPSEDKPKGKKYLRRDMRAQE